MKQAAVLVAMVLLAGCAAKSGGPAYVNPEIASAYSDFYTMSASDPAAASAALQKAKKADPENAYTLYLEASVPAQKREFGDALKLIQEGNGRTKIVHYVATPPPDDPMQTLNRVRQLGYALDHVGTEGEQGLEFIRAVRTAGRRVALAEPVTSLGAAAGISIVRRSYEAEVEYSKAKKSKPEETAAQQALEKFQTWNGTFSKGMAEVAADMYREAGKAANLTEAELADYSHDKPLKDKAKQEKADAFREKLYELEITTLKKLLEHMPEE
jgi:hypothetical protein